MNGVKLPPAEILASLTYWKTPEMIERERRAEAVCRASVESEAVYRQRRKSAQAWERRLRKRLERELESGADTKETLRLIEAAQFCQTRMEAFPNERGRSAGKQY